MEGVKNAYRIYGGVDVIIYWIKIRRNYNLELDMGIISIMGAICFILFILINNIYYWLNN